MAKRIGIGVSSLLFWAEIVVALFEIDRNALPVCSFELNGGINFRGAEALS